MNRITWDKIAGGCTWIPMVSNAYHRGTAAVVSWRWSKMPARLEKHRADFYICNDMSTTRQIPLQIKAIILLLSKPICCFRSGPWNLCWAGTEAISLMVLQEIEASHFFPSKGYGNDGKIEDESRMGINGILKEKMDPGSSDKF